MDNAHLSELRSRLGNDAEKIEDFELNKWLIACRNDVDKAENMFRKSAAYKEKMGVKTLLSNYNPPEAIKQYLPGGLCGVDREGRLVKVELFGKYDIAGLMRCCTLRELERSKLYESELIKKHAREQTSKTGTRVDGVTVVFDMEGTGTSALWKPGMDLYLHLVQILEDNYPDTLRKLMVVNAPTILPYLWALGKPILTEEMINKIFFYGSDYKEKLLESISAENLPAYLGGTMTGDDGDIRCMNKINQGGMIPMELTLRTDLHPWYTVVISQGCAYVIDLPVSKTPCRISWQVKTEDKDIGVELVFVTNDSKGNTEQENGEKRFNWGGSSTNLVKRKLQKENERSMVEYRRVAACYMVHDDHHDCWAPGLYRLIFDNTYSWTKQKKVFYLVNLS